MTPRVLISIVTHNSAHYLKRCLESLRAQTWRDCVVCLADNASTDGSLGIAAEYADFLGTIHRLKRNVGFCAAQNQLIAATPSDYVLVLNPDVVLEPPFLAILVSALEQDARAGSATGKLWRWQPGAETGTAAAPPLSEQVLDTTGMYLTPNQRHLDRGSGEPDRGQYESREYVFGASGAAALYRRAMLEEAKAGEEYFDEAFFAYREDADLAWRAQWLGWRCLYVPEAHGFHVRRVLPERRAALPADINMHSFKNRFLLRIKNMDAGTYARFLLPITARDAAALGYVLVREPSSLRAFPLLCKALPRAWAQRKALRGRRRVAPRELRSWFSKCPVSKPHRVGSGSGHPDPGVRNGPGFARNRKP
ncbi:MAG: glycosyltransferase family 2 protein [Acidobacteriia bacterium]|nr:glycosyltransferase family 2 protein [Terriglobia bacterium]